MNRTRYCFKNSSAANPNDWIWIICSCFPTLSPTNPNSHRLINNNRSNAQWKAHRMPPICFVRVTELLDYLSLFSIITFRSLLICFLLFLKMAISRCAWLETARSSYFHCRSFLSFHKNIPNRIHSIKLNEPIRCLQWNSLARNFWNSCAEWD